MTDRELLELAAKAAGVKGEYHPDNGIFPDGGGVSTEYWNPLIDDGDALRLAVKLRMDLMLYSDTKGAFIGSRGREEKQFAESDVNDPCAATRRAIVRAAAEIGKAMQ